MEIIQAIFVIIVVGSFCMWVANIVDDIINDIFGGNKKTEEYESNYDSEPHFGY